MLSRDRNKHLSYMCHGGIEVIMITIVFGAGTHTILIIMHAKRGRGWLWCNAIYIERKQF